jgi:hypothetical protein
MILVQVSKTRYDSRQGILMTSCIFDGTFYDRRLLSNAWNNTQSSSEWQQRNTNGRENSLCCSIYSINDTRFIHVTHGREWQPSDPRGIPVGPETQFQPARGGGNLYLFAVITVHMLSLFAHTFHSCVFFSFLLTISDPCVLLTERNSRLRFR